MLSSSLGHKMALAIRSYKGQSFQGEKAQESRQCQLNRSYWNAFFQRSFYAATLKQWR